MRLLRLDLHGFKSFPDRTTLHFGPGISCVVGPNGSGKSNVVDALRWCIGEQSARSLRGAEMADVIFGGSVDRKPVGVAEVALTLAATDDAPFPGDWAAFREVQVARRLHRSGTSEYLLNQTRVRRRDVIELLLDSGIGNNLYAFVEQGQVDRMITASAAERRTVIDEAAGIALYKVRRDEAQHRLDTTTTQLERAADVLDEMERHLAGLGAQVLKAAEFRRLRAIVKQGEIWLALAKHHALAAERRALRQQLDAVRADEEGAVREVARREEDLDERRAELALVEAAVTSRRGVIAELDGEARELEARRQLHTRRADELGADAARAEADAAREEERRVAAEEELAAAALGEAEIARATTTGRDGLAAARRGAEEAAETMRAARLAVDASEADLRGAIAQRAAKVADVQTAERAWASAVRRAEQAETYVASGSGAVLGVVAERLEAARRAAEHVARCSAAVDATRISVERAGAHEREVAARLDEAERARGAAERARAAELAGIEDASARGQLWLDSMAASTTADRGEGLEGAARDADRAVADAREALERAVAIAAALEQRIRHLDSERAALHTSPSDVHGGKPLLDRVPPGDRDRVIEVLGDRSTLPVVQDLAVLRGMLERSSGAEVLYWPEGHPPPPLRVAAAATLDEGLERVATGVPVAGPGFRVEPDGVVRLGRSVRAARDAALADERERVVAELGTAEEAVGGFRANVTHAEHDLAEARRKLREHDREMRSVLDAREAARTWLEARRAEVREAPPPVDRREHVGARQGLEAAVAAREQAVSAWTAALEVARDAELAGDRSATEADALALEAARARSDAERARVDAGEERRRLSAIEADAARATELEQAAALTVASHRADVAAAEALILARSEDVRRAEEVLATLAERRAGLLAASDGARHRALEAAQRRDASEAERLRLAAASAAARAEADAAVARSIEVSVRRREAWDALEAERARSATLTEALGGAERAHRDARDRADRGAAVASTLVERLGVTQASLEAMKRSMDERYQVSVAGLLDRLFSRGELVLAADPDVASGMAIAGRTVEGVAPVTVTPAAITDEDQVRAAVDTLELTRAALAGLGEVNLGAPEAYAELDARRAALGEQASDLEASVTSIRSAITKMNRMCRERFRDAFDRVNDAFQQAYPQLVGGGSARLSLTDDEDLLEAGVDIFVQPPGKRLQHLQLLSGGEKAMTAIALLIALFRVKPSPFCVLDEVDAPLDEANGARFNEVLRDMARSSQFLVVTHNRKTMECADTVYGITMAKPGVSTLVSVTL